MPLTMEEVLNNPAGKGSAGLARRDVIKENLRLRYQNIKDDIDYDVYKINESDYLFFFRIPSEEFHKEGLTYDVVLQFTPNEEINNGKKKNFLNNAYDLLMFSNNPNFTFTYAYVYYHDGLIPSFITGKLSRESIEIPPDTRNPKQEYGYEKSIYFSLLFIKENDLNKVSNLRKLRVIDPRMILSSIKSCDEKIKERKKYTDRKSKMNKALKMSKSKKALLRSIGGNKAVEDSKNARRNDVFKHFQRINSSGSTKNSPHKNGFKVVKAKRKLR